MNQNITDTRKTVSTLESICKRYEIQMMADVFEIWVRAGKPPKKKLNEVVELFEKLKQKADENVAQSQRGLGFCYEQGISEGWCKFAKRIVEIDDLHQQLIHESHECNQLNEQIKKLENQRKQFVDATEQEISLLFITPGSNDEYTKARKNNQQELEPLSAEINELKRQLIKIKNALLGKELLTELKKAEIAIYSSKTYQSKCTIEPEQAFKWYEKALQNGDKDACLDLGFCYIRGFGVPSDQQKAIALFNEAAEAGNSTAMRLLGDCYAEGVVFNKNDSKAHEYWSKAYVCKEPDRGLTFHKLYYLLGCSNEYAYCPEEYYIDQEEKKVKEDAELIEELVLFYLKEGYFPEHLLSKCQNWWDRFIERERLCIEISTELEFAIKYKPGRKNPYPRGFQYDKLDISVWLKRYAAGACYKGIPAYSKDGTQGIEKNQNKALEIWHTLAENNDPWACCRLGCHYLNQNLPTHDFPKARDYLNKAAECNFYPAHFALAIIYYYGINTEINLDLALAQIDKVVTIDENISETISGISKILSFCGENINDIAEIISSYKKIDHVPLYAFGFIEKAVVEGEINVPELWGPHHNSPWSFIEKIRLACLLFGKNVSNVEEKSEQLVLKLVHPDFNWGSDGLLQGVRENYTDNPAWQILCQYALELGKQKFTSKERMRFSKLSEFSYKAIILELTNQKLTSGWYSITECPVVFNALFNWIYQEHYDPLLLGILYFYKSYDFESSRCDTSDKNIEIASRWLCASDDLRSKNGPIELSSNLNDRLSNPLSGYYQALINEHSDPELALQILSKSEPDVVHDLEGTIAIDLLQRLKFKRFEVQARIKLRIEALEAKRNAQRAEAEAARANDLKTRLEKLVQRTSHTLANTIFPNTLYQVAERLKDRVELRRDALLLFDAYHAEVSIRHENELLQQRYTTDNPEPLRQIMRGDRRNLPNAEARSIEGLFDYALSRVIARFLNAHSAKFEPIRRQIISDKELSLDDLRQDFEESMFFREPPMTAQAWCHQHLRPIELIYRNPVWQEIGLKREGLAEALIYGHFAEILFNAFKYADHTAVDFLQVELDEFYQNDERYLTLTWRNPLSTERPGSMGSGQGLEAIKEDLRQLNGQYEAAPTLDSWQDNGFFYLRLSYQADLLWLQPMPEVDIVGFLFKD